MNSKTPGHVSSGYWRKYWPDIPLFLVIIPLIAAFNYYLTYTDIRLNGYHLLRFTVDSLQGYLAWLVVRHLIIKLDKLLPYEGGMCKRLWVQFPLITVSGLLVIGVSTEILSILVVGKTAPLNFYTFDLVIISFWFLFINAFYTGLYFFLKTKDKLNNHESLAENKTSVRLKVSSGNRSLFLKESDISYIYRDGEYSVICTVDDRQFLLSESLHRLHEELSEALFFRANRSIIVHRNVISGFQKMENRKLLLLLDGVTSYSPIYVSRSRAPEFRMWFESR